MGFRDQAVGVRDKLQRFEDLEVWKKSQDLAVLVYEIAKGFPDDEKFGLTSQVKRASSSVSANIAEGFGRSGTKDKLHFYTIAHGSLLETKNFLYLAHKLSFINSTTLNESLTNVVECQKLLQGLIASLRRRL